MSEVWRLQTKTDLSQINTNGISVAEYCINEAVMAMGWTLRESIYKELSTNEQNDLKNQEKEIVNDFEKLSRKSFRKCLICEAQAQECGRSRKHSVGELQNKVEEILKKSLAIFL